HDIPFRYWPFTWHIFPSFPHFYDVGLFFRFFRTVFRTALLTTFNTCGIECATYNVVTNTRQVFHTASANQNDTVLLEVMADTRNIRRHFHIIRSTDTGVFAQCRVRLFRCQSSNTCTYPAFLWWIQGCKTLFKAVVAFVQCWGIVLFWLANTAFSH